MTLQPPTLDVVIGFAAVPWYALFTRAWPVKTDLKESPDFLRLMNTISIKYLV